jgi:anaerobic selenocysteine-containing dehydrogenase
LIKGIPEQLLKQGVIDMKQWFNTACPLDCWDQCALLAEVDQGRVVSLKAHPDQPVTGGFICAKGKKQLSRINHRDRLRYPLLKRGSGSTFSRISWSEAAEIIGEKIGNTVDKYGPLALLHYSDGGYGGLLKDIEGRFFSALGGCTLHRGSLCWAAGIAAQRYDFGAVMSHPYQDILKAKLIIVWGRNPAFTQVHLMPYLKAAREKGTRVILIDPLETSTARLADHYIRVKPASDGALALGMAKVIIEQGFDDRRFIETKSSGFEQFKALCARYDLQRVAGLTGLSEEQIEKLALEYAEAKPAAILLGIGLQRHSNGGNTVRAIDALAALTGNVGVSGGGASYANFQVTRYIDHDYLSGKDLQPIYRYYPKPKLAKALKDFYDPPVKFIYISRANPLAQVGDSSSLQEALRQVPFIVTAEHFMTDSAAASNLVLPATAFLEAEDLYFNSMSHPYLVYGEKVVEPPGECRPEYDFFAELAGGLKLKDFPAEIKVKEQLVRAIKPLTEATGITIQQIRKEGPLLMPGADEIPWREGQFETTDGKYNFYSKQAEEDGAGGLPEYREPLEINDEKLKQEGYLYWFVTAHMRNSIHSTHLLPDTGLEPKAYVSSELAEKEKIVDDDLVAVLSKRGRIELKVAVSDDIPPDTVLVYQGWWEKSGAAVNKLTADRLTDFGNQAAYYDCLCRVEKLLI